VRIYFTLLYTTEPILITGCSYKMFEPNMDEYLDDEMEELKRAFEVICKDWERSISLTTSSIVRIHPSIVPSMAHDPFFFFFALRLAFRVVR